MKTLKFATIALVSTGIAFSAPLAAQDRGQDEENILVQPTSEEERYAARVGRQLDRNLARYSFPLRTREVGIVKVQFVANGAGVAEDLTIVGESGSNRLDRAALWAIGRLSEISPGEDQHPEGRVLQANIVFADSERQAAAMFRQLGREEAARMALARERGERPVLALNLGSGARAN